MATPARIGFVVGLGICGVARAQTADPDIDAIATPPREITTAVREGALLPSTLAPRVGITAGLAFGFGGYDARDRPRS